MINKKESLIGLGLIVVILLSLTLVSPQIFSGSNTYSRSFTSYSPTYVPYSGDPGFPLFDRSMCEAGQDFILQVDPLGCEPSVVRSDLLEDQNVPVFCPIVATKLNPLIDIEAIDYITFSFSGPKPREVVGVTYVPARAALGRYGAQLNQPVLNNIGYAVIVLKRQGNSSAMPEFILGNLTARISYDIKNAFGVGRANFYLPELTNEEWEENFRQYGFWDSRGYLRADGIDNQGARISVYSDRETYGSGKSGEKRKLQTVDLNIGETSREIFMPGFDYCLGTMQIKLNGLENPDTRAKLRINEDIVEVKEGERFLENKCVVTNLVKNGVNEKVTISCQEDERRGSFNLVISPKINLRIDGVVREVSVGDLLYKEINEEGKETGKSVYLTYVGTKGNTNAENNLFIVAISMPGQGNKLTETQINSFSRLANRFQYSKLTGNKLTDALISVGEFSLGAFEAAFRGVVKGQSLKSVSFGDSEKVFGKTLAIAGFADALNADISKLPDDLRNYYEKAIKDYDTVIESFSQEQFLEAEGITLGQIALAKKIELSWDLDQRKTVPELCNEFEDKYPDSLVQGVCNQDYKFSSTESAIRDVLINGRTYRIAFDRIREPGPDEFSAEILITNPQGETKKYTLRKNEIIHLNTSTKEFIQLLDLHRDNIEREAAATISVGLQIERSIAGATKDFILGTSTKRLNKDLPQTYGSKYQFTLLEVNLKKMAKVSINPQINYARTEANFKFKIGIEKRGIQLSPEKTREKIESLNKTLEKWQDINGKLGNVVTGLKTACLGVGTTLTVKNFFSNLGGKGIARQKVMRGDEGWFVFCEKEVAAGGYGGSVDSCLFKNSPEIDKSVDEYLKMIEQHNEEAKSLQAGITTDGFLGEDIVDTEAYTKGFVNDNYRQERLEESKNIGLDKIKIDNKDVEVSDIINSINPETVFLTQARNLQLNSRLLNSPNERVRAIALAEVKRELADIWVNSREEFERQGFVQEVGSEAAAFISTKKLKEIPVTNVETWSNVKNQYSGASINDKSFVYFLKDKFDGQRYLLVLDNDYVINQTYNISSNKVLRVVDEDTTNPLRLSLKKFDKTTYKNKYLNPEIRYYEAGPYKGFPAIVPFDLEEGWYAYVKSTLPVGGAIGTYDKSGRVSSFWLCNVGGNGRDEFNSGIGDDICEMINLGTGQPYNQFHGIKDASSLVSCAVDAIEDVSNPRSRVGSVRVSTSCGGTLDIKVGKPAIGVPDIQCQDFMSPTDCNLIFNVCDPVICPSSRCNLGGAYPVKDVIQSGIAGSLALCLPNFPEVKVPVCLSGVHAGIEGLITVFDSYQQCLQTSLDTGQTVGICDEIHSIYMCDFFWRQSIPLAKIAITKGLGTVLGQNVRGGGEYLGVADAWTNAGNSADFFTQQYAANSFKAFKARSVEDVGTAVCKNFVSIAGPQGGNLLDALTTPDSPTQFYGRFDEIPFTTATNPPISQYKVFYHIYAGKDFPAYYQVYLRGTEGSFYQDASFRRIVAQGFIKAGDYFTETRDLTAPSGYQQMCIIVNGQEECGFKQVTTSFGVNYITEQYVASQATQKDITSEAACISGTPSVYSLLSPNLQAGVGEITNPAIYNRGITRICATNNPGLGTDGFVNPKDMRWQPVGHCGNTKIQCWLDMDSIRNTIRNTNIENKIIDDVTGNYLEQLQKEGGYLTESEFKSLVEEINKEESSTGKIDKINENLDKIFFEHEKGYLILLRAEAYKVLALTSYYSRYYSRETLGETTPPTDDTQSTIDKIKAGEKSLAEALQKGSITGEEAIAAGLISGYISYPIFLFEDGINDVFTEGDLYYSYSGVEWHWSQDKNNLFGWRGVEERPPESFLQKNKNFIASLRNKDYSEGLNLLMERTVENRENRAFVNPFNSRLSTERVKFLHTRRFIVSEYLIDTRQDLRFEYNTGIKKWKWSLDATNWIDVPQTEGTVYFEEEIVSEPVLVSLIEKLEGKEFIEGAEIIFDIDSTFEGSGEYIGTGDSGGEIKITCSTSTECQQLLGKKIIELAKAKKQPGMDADVRADTGASSFECLVLQVANTESRIRQCIKSQENENPLYCEGNQNEVIGGDSGDSFGIMQINTAFKNTEGERIGHCGTYGLSSNFGECRKQLSDIETNVNIGINLLISSHGSSEKIYNCYRPSGYGSVVRESDFVSKGYSGWQRALRQYNGWNSLCSRINEDDERELVGNPHYVEDVIGFKDEVASLFPECGS